MKDITEHNKITLFELDQFLKNYNPSCILYSTDDQDWFDALSFYPAQTSCFSGISVTVNPNTVMLYHEHSKMYFKNLKHAVVCKDSSPIGTVVLLIGENFYNRGCDVKYKIIIR